MEKSYRVVKLLKNEIYPTYQLYAAMNSKKTTPEEGIRLGALITLGWLKERIGDNPPEELSLLPAPDQYKALSQEALPSFHINSGYVIDVVSLPEKGIWTLQITEPDLGSDPGNPAQVRQAVPGRVIETNIGFCIAGQTLECGFQTVVSDPVGTQDRAEVYRLSPVRRLMEHPAFGLRQILPLGSDVGAVRTAEQLKALFSIWRDENNQLPCVVFTQTRQEQPLPAPFPLGGPLPALASLPPQAPAKTVVADPPYPMADFAVRGRGFCRTYLLSDGLWDKFSAQLSAPLAQGDIAVLEPFACGGGVQVFPFKPSKQRQEETMGALWRFIGTYCRGKELSFGHIIFLSAAREALFHHAADATRQSDEVSVQWAQRLEQLKAAWRSESERQDQQMQALSNQLNSQRQYAARLEEEKAQLRKEAQQAKDQCQLRLDGQKEELDYLRRKLDRPSKHKDIPAWCESYFSGRLLFHPKAEALLAEKAAAKVDVDLICDALDFLATDYWERRYRQISSEEMHTRCSQKYGRPFEINPSGSATVEFTPSQYKVKYGKTSAGKDAERDLDWHLRVGNAPETLLRIYFFHDDEKQCIVIGSLPLHLRTLTMQ